MFVATFDCEIRLFAPFAKVEAMMGKFSLVKLNNYGGQSASFFMILYLFTMIIMIMNFFVAILNDFLAAVANSKEMQSRDFEVMDHFVNTVTQMVTSRTEEQKGETVHFSAADENSVVQKYFFVDIFCHT